MSLRRRFAATIWAVALAAIVTSACAPSEGEAETASPSEPEMEIEVASAPEPTLLPMPEPPAEPTVAPTATKAPLSAASELRPTISATFLIGNTQGRGMPMRTAPVPTQRGKLWPDGTTMQGLGGEREAYGWTWAWVQDPDGSSGWMPINFLIPAAGSPDGIGAAAVPTLVPAPPEPPTRPGLQPTTVPAAAAPPAVSSPQPAQVAMSLPVASKPDAASPSQPTEWALAFDRIEPLTQAELFNEAGVSRTQVATGIFQRIFFRAKNKQDKSASLPTSTFTLTDEQGRTYTSDFQVRQVQGTNLSAPFGSANVVPGVTVALSITFDVATDATGLVLHMKGASSIKIQ